MKSNQINRNFKRVLSTLIFIVLIICSLFQIIYQNKDKVLNVRQYSVLSTFFTLINDSYQIERKEIINSIQNVTCEKFDKTKCNFLVTLFLGTSGIIKNEESNQLIVDFRKTGIAHLLAVSGFNVTLIIQIVTVLLILFPYKYRVYFVIMIVITYMLLVGLDNIPALRATIFGFVLISSKYLGWKVRSLRLLIYYVLLSLLIDISLIKNLSFLLTVGSILGIVLIQKRISSFISNILPIPFDEALSVTLSALTIVIPISAIFFNNLSIISPISNIIVTPFAPILTVLYVLFLITGSWLRDVIAILLKFILDALFYIINFLSNSEMSEIYFPKYFMILLLLIILVIFILNNIWIRRVRWFKWK